LTGREERYQGSEGRRERDEGVGIKGKRRMEDVIRSEQRERERERQRKRERNRASERGKSKIIRSTIN
jgi:hypothetical protein